MTATRKMLQTIGIIFFTITILLVFSTTAFVLQPPVNTTVIIGADATFFCQINGSHEYVRVNGILIGDDPRGRPKDILFSSTLRTEPPINVTITITNVSVERNNTRIDCSDIEKGLAEASTAYLTIRGGPAVPEVEYKIQREEEEEEGVLLSWPRPFSWEEYPITGYDVVCRDRETEVEVENKRINETGDEEMIQHTVKLSSSDCLIIQCTVTAYNDLNSSPPSISNISIPKRLEGEINIPVTQDIKFTPTSKPEVELCAELPILCEFQTVSYTIIISGEEGSVLEISRNFSYSSGDISQCVTVGGEDGQLEEGIEYSLQVFISDGSSVNVFSYPHSFKPEIVGPGGVNSSSDEEFALSEVWRIVLIVAAALLLMTVLIVITIIIVSCRRNRSQRQQVTKAPLKRTPTAMVNNPIYERDSHDGDSNPHYEQVGSSLSRLNSISSHTNLDSPNQRLITPSNIAITSGSNRQLYHSGVPNSPSTNSNNFSWPYAGVQPPNSGTFDAIEADVQSQLAARPTTPPQVLPPCTPGEESYMTMQPAVGKNTNLQQTQGQPRYAIDIHGNRYIEC